MRVTAGKLKMAVVGCGYWGKNLTRNFHELGVLDTICDSDETRLRAIKESYPDVHITESMDDILSNKVTSSDSLRRVE